MALPLVPIAYTTLRIGTVAATAWYVARRTRSAPKHIWRETALDDTPEGLEVTTNRSEAESNAHASTRFTRVIRLPNGRGVEVDIAGLARIRFRKI